MHRRSKCPHTVAATLFAAVHLSLLSTSPASTIEFDALNLASMPQPAFDISLSRPLLRFNRPERHAINSQGHLVGVGDAGVSQLNQDARPLYFHNQAATTANLGDLTEDFADPADPTPNGMSKAYGINDAGWVVGVSSTSAGTGTADDRPFLWFDDDRNHANTSGEMRELTLNPGATWGKALSVNNTGQVLIAGDTGLYRADFSLNAGLLTEAPGRTLINANADLVDLNDAGDVAYIQGSQGFVWRDLDSDDFADPNETTHIPFMSAAFPNAQAFAINNAGQVAGTMRNDNARDIGFIWTDLNGDNIFDWNDSNTNGFFEANETSAEVIRFHGDAAGINAASGSTFVFDLNDNGATVGGYFDSADRRAFIFDPVIGMRFLDDLIDPLFPLQLRQADAINNAGQIAAVGRPLGQMTDQPVLLSPIGLTLNGDLDNDGFIGIDDLNIVLAHWNQNVPPGDLLQGDATGEGFVGVDDLNIVLINWNNGTPPGTPGDAAVIPEPEAVVMWGTGGLVLMRWRPVRGKPA